MSKSYLTGIEMSNYLNNHFIILIWCLVPWYNDLSTGEILQLIDLWLVRGQRSHKQIAFKTGINTAITSEKCFMIPKCCPTTY